MNDMKLAVFGQPSRSNVITESQRLIIAWDNIKITIGNWVTYYYARNVLLLYDKLNCRFVNINLPQRERIVGYECPGDIFPLAVRKCGSTVEICPIMVQFFVDEEHETSRQLVLCQPNAPNPTVIKYDCGYIAGWSRDQSLIYAIQTPFAGPFGLETINSETSVSIHHSIPLDIYPSSRIDRILEDPLAHFPNTQLYMFFGDKICRVTLPITTDCIYRHGGFANRADRLSSFLLTDLWKIVCDYAQETEVKTTFINHRFQLEPFIGITALGYIVGQSFQHQTVNHKKCHLTIFDPNSHCTDVVDIELDVDSSSIHLCQLDEKRRCVYGISKKAQNLTMHRFPLNSQFFVPNNDRTTPFLPYSMSYVNYTNNAQMASLLTGIQGYFYRSQQDRPRLWRRIGSGHVCGTFGKFVRYGQLDGISNMWRYIGRPHRSDMGNPNHYAIDVDEYDGSVTSARSPIRPALGSKGDTVFIVSFGKTAIMTFEHVDTLERCRVRMEPLSVCSLIDDAPWKWRRWIDYTDVNTYHMSVTISDMASPIGAHDIRDPIKQFSICRD